MAQYIFRLDDFIIYRTRARFNDTLTVSYFLKVGNTNFQPYIIRIGDVSNTPFGVHPLGLTFGPVEVAPGDEVKFSYIFINSGYDASNQGAVKAVTDALSDAGAEALKSEGPIAAGIAVLLNDLVHLLHTVFYANCDGIVAADAIGTKTPPNPGDRIVPLTGADLADWTAARGVYSEQRSYPGTDSPVGCGANSLYNVTWSVTQPDAKQSKDSKDKEKDTQKEKHEGKETTREKAQDKDLDSAAMPGTLSTRLQALERRVDEIAQALPTKKAFIAPQERPSVGEAALNAPKAPETP